MALETDPLVAGSSNASSSRNDKRDSGFEDNQDRRKRFAAEPSMNGESDEEFDEDIFSLVEPRISDDEGSMEGVLEHDRGFGLVSDSEQSDGDWDKTDSWGRYMEKFLEDKPFDGNMMMALMQKRHGMSTILVEDVLKFISILMNRPREIPLERSVHMWKKSLKGLGSISFTRKTCCKNCGHSRKYSIVIDECKSAECVARRLADHTLSSKNRIEQEKKTLKENQIVIFSLRDSLQQLVLMNPSLFDARCDDLGNEIATENTMMNGVVYRTLHRIDPDYIEPNGPTKHKYRLSLILSYDDGQLRRSTNAKVSPISFVIAELDNPSRYNRANVMLLGAWIGKGKPDVPRLWKKVFWNQFKGIKENGNKQIALFDNNGAEFLFSLDVICMCADQPATAESAGHTYPSGTYACTHCTIKTVHLPETVDPETGKKLKKAHSFKYQEEFQPKESYLSLADGSTKDEQLGVIDYSVLNNFMLLPDQIPRDVMHLLYEGACKKLISLIFGTGRSKRKIIEAVDGILSGIATPHDFQPKPNLICKEPNWKGKDYKMFLFYFFPVMKNIIPNEQFIIFGLLSIMTRLLSSKRMALSHENLYAARHLADRFYFYFEKFFGERNCSSKIHGVIHLVDQVEHFGTLSNTCTFAFEDLIGSLQNAVHGTTDDANQIINYYLSDKGIQLALTEKKFDLTNDFEKFADKFTTSAPEKTIIEDYPDGVAILDKMEASGLKVIQKVIKEIPEYEEANKDVNIALRIIYKGFEFHSSEYKSDSKRVFTSDSHFVEYKDDHGIDQLADIICYLLPTSAELEKDPNSPVMCIARKYVSDKLSGIYDKSMIHSILDPAPGSSKKRKEPFSDCFTSSVVDLAEQTGAFFWSVNMTNDIIFFPAKRIQYKAIRFQIDGNPLKFIATVIDHSFEYS